ncbi:MAG: ADP-forming succinate--CoA ligase subunit beta [Pseudomonadota bacterium]|nr:ADP-forming succinate--CoA ligase subunit beta [Pseudomonadota bacterium]
MNLHEYQSKAVFRRFGIPVPDSVLARETGDIDAVPSTLPGEGWVVKAQVHAGGRGKAGGVRIARDDSALREAVSALLGATLSTHQTGSRGLPIHTLLIEPLTGIRHEYYLSMLVDRTTRRVTVMASAAGGMDIEAVAAESPDRILTEAADPVAGLSPYQVRKLGFALGLDKTQIGPLGKILTGLYRLFQECDASLVEINPLVVTDAGDLLALDAKVNLDDNALYRHPDLLEMRDISQEDAAEAEAAEHDLNYIRLDGNIGCMVNGAGLAMATMDLIKLHGGEPANFLDVGGGTTAERVAEAFKLILSDDSVRAILVNIFGGIVRCDLIAEGILKAVEEAHVAVPLVVRLEGTNVDQGRQLLADSGMHIISADGLTDAARKVVAAAETAA